MNADYDMSREDFKTFTERCVQKHDHECISHEIDVQPLRQLRAQIQYMLMLTAGKGHT